MAESSDRDRAGSDRLASAAPSAAGAGPEPSPSTKPQPRPQLRPQLKPPGRPAAPPTAAGAGLQVDRVEVVEVAEPVAQAQTVAPAQTGRGLTRDELIQPDQTQVLGRPFPPPGPSGEPPLDVYGPDPGVPPRTPAQRGRGLRWATGAGVVLVGGYVAAAWMLSGSAPKGTTVAGVAVGGKDRAAIVSALTAAAQKQDGALAVVLGDQTAGLDLASSGLSVDPGATAGELTGFTLNPVALLDHLRGGGAQEAASAPGQAGRQQQLESALRALSAKLAVKPVNAAITFTPAAKGDPSGAVTPAVKDPIAGTTLNIAKSAQAIRLGWLGGPRPLVLPVDTQQPEITKAQAQQALEELARPAVSGPLTLTVGEVKVTVTPAQFGPALGIAAGEGGALDLTVDGAKLSQAVLAASPEIGTAPKDARIELKNGKPRIIPGVQGVTLDPEKVGPAVRPALTSSERTASVPTKVEQPKFSTADAEELGVEQRVSTFSTVLTDNQLRTQNLRVAARTVNGTLVLPGETFSLNGVLGQRTAAKGYNQAPAINGGRLIQDYGGGVSQMATTIFNNVFFSGLEDIYHKPHSFYISRYPEGREATVNYPTVDLKWRNDSKYGVLIQANVTNKVNVSFWSTKVWDITALKSGRTNPRLPSTVYDDKDSCVTQVASPGFDVNVTRIFSKAGKEVRRETFHATYIAEDKVVCGPEPDRESTGDQD